MILDSGECGECGRRLDDVRILAVIGDELMGADEGRDWAVLEALVAANGPSVVDVYVLAMINDPGNSILFGMPLGKAIGRRSVPAAGARYDPGESARQRLERALRYLRGLGVHASGDTASGDPCRAVRRQVAAGQYDRVLLLLRDRTSWLSRISGRSVQARLRRSLAIPVDALGPSDIVAPEG
jgi:hypothetical protein